MDALQDALLSNALTTAATFGEMSLKNPKSKAKVKKSAKKVFDMLVAAYPEFLEDA